MNRPRTTRTARSEMATDQASAAPALDEALRQLVGAGSPDAPLHDCVVLQRLVPRSLLMAGQGARTMTGRSHVELEVRSALYGSRAVRSTGCPASERRRPTSPSCCTHPPSASFDRVSLGADVPLVPARSAGFSRLRQRHGPSSGRTARRPAGMPEGSPHLATGGCSGSRSESPSRWHDVWRGRSAPAQTRVERPCGRRIRCPPA
jgi:hypothetical protein